MANRALWLFLFALTALQSTWSAPTSKKLQLEFDVANEMYQLVTDIFEDLKAFVQRVIDEAEHILPPDTKSVALEMFQELARILNTIDIDDSLETERMVEALEDIMSLFDSLDSAELSSEAEEIVLSIFEQFGGKEMEGIQENKLAQALQRIERMVANYIGTWSDSRLARNSEFLKWFMEFKNEKDAFEKLDLLIQGDLI